MSKHISILNYYNGQVIIHKVEDDVDSEDYVSTLFGLDNVSWMETKELNLSISTIQ